jgi:hypothetical protein
VPRAQVAEVIAFQISWIDYTKFKASVGEVERHDTYHIWAEMARWQVMEAPAAKTHY